MKKALFWGLLLILLYFFIELTCYAALQFAKIRKSTFYRPVPFQLSAQHKEEIRLLLSEKIGGVRHDSVLGWTLPPRGTGPVNSQGLSAEHNPAFERKLRVATFGESFTQGVNVSDEETWQGHWVRINPALEVTNFGLGGYGLDQAFLRYKAESARLESQVTMIGFMSENIYRTVSVFRPFYLYFTGLPLTKPRFVDQNGRLTLIENPLPTVKDYRLFLTEERKLLKRLGEHDFFYKEFQTGAFNFLPSVQLFKIILHTPSPLINNREAIISKGIYNTRSEAFKVTAMIFDEFHREVLKNGSLPIIIVYPTASDIRQYRKNRTKVYQPLIDYLTVKGFRHVDLMEAFEMFGKGNKVGDFFGPNHHYSSFGNEIVARYLSYYWEKNRIVGFLAEELQKI